MELEGKTVLITGASTGIGLASAKLFAENKARVVINSRNKSEIEKISKTIPGSIAIAADMSKEEEARKLVQETVRACGKIDILINNAGKGYDASVEKTSIKTFKEIIELDVIGPLAAMQEAIPVMKKQGGGAIINISSGTALMSLPNMAAYSGAKRMLAGISLTAREELKKDRITVSVVYPYMTLTDFEKNTIKEEKREWEGKPRYPPDTAQFIAEKIVECAKNGEAEVFAHDWMKQ